MVKILYGLCGEGLGHAIRGKILINFLKKRHEIIIVAGGKAYPYIAKEFDDVHKIESPHFVYKKNEVNLFLTIIRMIFITFIKAPFSYIKIRKIINKFQPEILITDAEPISFYASKGKIKRLSIDNQQAIFHRSYNVAFGNYIAWFALYIILKLAMLGADKYIIYDFLDEQIKNDKILFIKPLIQKKLLEQKPKNENHIFVYQTSITSKKIFHILKDIDEKFIIYGYDEDKVEGNLTFKKFNDLDFYKDISNSKAVITNGGFTVLSEALYLKKPIFSIPIRNQFEQILNGQFIKKIGAGIYKNDFFKKDILKFIQNLDCYKKNLESYSPGMQNNTLKLIEEQINLLVNSR